MTKKKEREKYDGIKGSELETHLHLLPPPGVIFWKRILDNFTELIRVQFETIPQVNR